LVEAADLKSVKCGFESHTGHQEVNRMYKQEVLQQYIAEQAKAEIDPNDVEIVEIKSSPSRAWSEITFESFSCRIVWLHKPSGKENYIFMGEDDVVDFLNWFAEKEV
jgi:hypothetical protein